jgi:hypothetical protein
MLRAMWERSQYDFADLAVSYLTIAHAQNVNHCGLFFDGSLSVLDGQLDCDAETFLYADNVSRTDL